jgi:Zn-dependent M28 family amino/carboxypeptidase
VRSLSVLSAVLLIAGCGDDGATGAEDATVTDAAIDAAVDAPPDAAVVCTAVDDCPWLEDALRDVVGKLSGERPIVAGGPLLSRRASVAQRATAREYLRDQLVAWGLPATLVDYGGGINVVVRLPATTGATSPLIVVGAHYDGIAASPAAGDNGTGAALVMVAARYLGGLTRRDLPIEVVLYDQEEIGLIGSTAHARALFTAGAVVDSVHVFDLLSIDADGDHALELWSATPAVAATYQLHGDLRGSPIRLVTFSSSDHASYLDRGYPTVGASEEFVSGDRSAHYHRVTDTFDKIDFTYLARMTRLALDVIADRAIE